MNSSNPILTAPPKQVELTDEQRVAVESISQWLSRDEKPEFKLGGYAGTGKTTVIKAIRAHLRGKAACQVCAFTGKAVNVLQRKDIRDASTIHFFIYNVEILKGGLVEFHLKPKRDVKADLIIVDEASMISQELYDALRSFDIPILFVGDPGQLEPVGDNPNLMAQPDLVLSKIHRQAEHSPIITFANDVRHGKKIVEHQQDGLIVRDKKMVLNEVASHDQVICARNKTRKQVNDKFRYYLERPTTEIRVDDKLIILRNNQAFQVFNGMIIFVDEITYTDGQVWIINARDEIDRKFSNLPIWRHPFEKELPKEFSIPKYKDNQMVYCDFGYCITCHKSQGSEWDSVLVWHEWMPPQIWDMKRWSYTAITRAAKELTYCL